MLFKILHTFFTEEEKCAILYYNGMLQSMEALNKCSIMISNFIINTAESKTNDYRSLTKSFKEYENKYFNNEKPLIGISIEHILSKLAEKLNENIDKNSETCLVFGSPLNRKHSIFKNPSNFMFSKNKNGHGSIEMDFVSSIVFDDGLRTIVYFDKSKSSFGTTKNETHHYTLYCDDIIKLLAKDIEKYSDTNIGFRVGANSEVDFHENPECYITSYKEFVDNLLKSHIEKIQKWL